MSREAALQSLKAASWQLRLKAARLLLDIAQPDDLPAIMEARAIETVRLVGAVLNAVVRRVNRDTDEARASTTEENPSQLVKQLHSKAVEEVTRTLLHELEPIVGVLKLIAAEEIVNYETSRVKAQIDVLGHQLSAIGQLKTAARVPVLEKLSLHAWLTELIETSGHPRDDFSLVGSQELIVECDAALLRLALGNGLKNAIEAVEALRPWAEDNQDPPRIVISWDHSQRECWICIKDEGAGLSGPATEVVKIGRTSKPGHAGMGLAIAKQAIETMGGTLELEPGSEAGTRFEVRWFLP